MEYLFPEVFPTQKWSPPYDLIKYKDHILLQMDVPGLKKNELSVDVEEGNYLLIRGFVEKGGPSKKKEELESTQKSQKTKPEKPEKPEKLEKPEKPEKPERTEKTEKTEKKNVRKEKKRVKHEDDDEMVDVDDVDYEDESEEEYLRRERRHRNFEVRIMLPDLVDIEKLTAELLDGVLSISIPFQEEKLISKKINID